MSAQSTHTINSKENFVIQVKDKIVEEHGKDKNASFIFGLSGKWGEGKTDFLIELEKRLIDKRCKKNFSVVWISPWKFGDDKISFLRNFLKEVAKNNQRSWQQQLRDKLNNRNWLQNLEKDQTEVSIHWGIVLLIFLFTLIIVISQWQYSNIEKNYPQLIALLNTNKGLLKTVGAVIGIPFIIPLLSKLITTQVSNKAITTVDCFNDLLSQEITHLKSAGLIVFVDDLDRVTPEVAKTTLDNMRLFFDKPEITFVVTGDHTVLERHIGAQALPNSESSADKLEEGRRYLKKVFNLYWHLPSPIESEFNKFILDTLSKRQDEIDTIFPNKRDGEQFIQLLNKYFEKNFRQVLRFLDTTFFTFKIIQSQAANAQGAEKAYYTEMLSKPQLVIRILMIQDLCPPLFELISVDTGKLRSLEDSVEKKDNGQIDAILKGCDLSSNQSVFIRKFLYEEPRFFTNKRLQVKSFTPYLFLAADTNLGDARGLSGEDFIQVLKDGDPSQVANSLESSGEEKSNEAIKATTELINNTTDPTMKGGYLHTLCIALTSLPDHTAQSGFIKNLQEADLTPIFTGNENTSRLTISQDFWHWLDTQDRSKSLEMVDKFPFVQANDLDKLDLSKKFGHFSSRVVSRWMMSYYPSNKELIRSKMTDIFPHLNKDVVTEEIIRIYDQLTTDLMNEVDLTKKEALYQLVMEYRPKNDFSLKDKVFASIKSGNEDIWEWGQAKTEDGYKPWDKYELETVIINSLQSVDDHNILIPAIRYAATKPIEKLDQVWTNILNSNSGVLIETIRQISTNSYPSFKPSRKHALALFETILSNIETSNEEKKINLLPILSRNWIWDSISKIPHLTRVKKLLEDNNSNVVTQVKGVLASWSVKINDSVAKPAT